MIKALISIAVAVALSATCYAKETVFYIGQTSDQWAFKVTGKGRVLTGETLVYSDYEYVRVVNNPKHNKSRTVKYIELDYAYALPNGKWDVRKPGVRKELNRVLKPGEWMTVNWIGSRLSLEDESVDKYWLVVTVSTEDGLVHAHSRRDILK